MAFTLIQNSLGQSQGLPPDSRPRRTPVARVVACVVASVCVLLLLVAYHLFPTEPPSAGGGDELSPEEAAALAAVKPLEARGAEASTSSQPGGEEASGSQASKEQESNSGSVSRPPLAFPDGTRDKLGVLLEQEGKQTGAEVGVQKGAYSEKILSDWPSCKRFYLIDIWRHQANYIDAANVDDAAQDVLFQETKERLKPWESITVFYRMTSVEAAPKIEDDSLDFVYIDARHDFCGTTEDLDYYWPKVKSGGIMAGHDYYYVSELGGQSDGQDWGLCMNGTRNPGAVRGAVEEFFGARGIEIVTTPNEWRSWMVRKP